MSDLNTFYPEGKEITVRGEKFVIKPFVLRNRTKVIRILSESMLLMSKMFPSLKPEDLTSANAITGLIELAGTKLVDIYEVVLGKPRDWLEDITLSEEFSIIQSVVEVNNLPFLISQVKGMIATIKAKSS